MIPRLTALEPVARAYRDYLTALQRSGFGGDLRPDMATRLVTATDNSVYQLLPQAVAYPRTVDDVVAALSLLAEDRFRAVTLTPRGGGTGTNGQSLTDGLVLDVSRHMNRILETNLEQGWVRVQPGVVLDQLNAHLKPHGVFFAPNLSPSSRATIGGMIATDACGKGSRIYGRTSEHLLATRTVLVGGEVLETAPLEEAALTQRKGDTGRAADVHRVVDAVITEHADTIAEVFPKLRRFMTGYNLARIRRDERFDLGTLLSGAEGTLGVVVEATLRIVPIPSARQVVVLKYASFEDALASAEELVESDPGAIETIDETVLTLARKDVIWHEVGPLVGDDPAVRCVNLVEYEGEDPDVVQRKAQALRSHERAVGAVFAETAAEAAALWSLRKKGVGLLGNAPGPRRPVAFVEDTVVPPERLRAYVAEFRAILDSRGLRYGMFGHIDVGCLHVRPALDLTDPDDERLLREVSDEVAALVQRYGGVIWGEHGKGMRSEYNPRYFGDVLYAQLCRIKAAFDPHNQLNPGKIAVAPGTSVQLVSVDAPRRGAMDRQVPPPVREHFDRAIACNGNGQCFDWDPDHVMCPSSKVTRDRIHSPKGRAGVLREWLRQVSQAGVDARAQLGSARWWQAPMRALRRLGGGYDYSHEVYAAMDGCLACKACATRCPIQVDVPALRSDFLDLYHTRYGRPLRDYFVAALEGMLPVAARAPRLFNALQSAWPGRVALDTAGMVDTPDLSAPTAAEGLLRRGVQAWDPARIEALTADDRARTVVIVPDAFTTFFEADVLLAAVDLLRSLGYRAEVLPFVPSGKGLHIKGFRRRFHRHARRAATWLSEAARLDLPMVGLDPAVTLYWREEVVEALGPQTYRVHLLQEWLETQPLRPLGFDRRFTLFGHCTERTSQPGAQAQWQRVFERLGLRLDTANVGCCGMCGVFGHEAHHLEESRGVFDLSWARRLPESRNERLDVLATGHSCRSQVKRFAHFRPRHPVEALAALAVAARPPA